MINNGTLNRLPKYPSNQIKPSLYNWGYNDNL